MNRLYSVIAVFALFAILAILSTPAFSQLLGRRRTVDVIVQRPETHEQAAIQRVLDDQTAAWNKGDLEGFMAGYWRSPELTFYSGATVTKGWQGTLERYKTRYQGEGKEMGKVTFSDVRIDVLGPDSAIVRGKWGLVKKDEKLGGLFTLVCRKLPEGWRIVHDHTSN